MIDYLATIPHRMEGGAASSRVRMRVWWWTCVELSVLEQAIFPPPALPRNRIFACWRFEFCSGAPLEPEERSGADCPLPGTGHSGRAMWSPREKASHQDGAATPSIASPPPVSTPNDSKVEGSNPMASPKAGMTPNGGIFNSFSKMLFGGEGEEGGTPEPNGTASSDPSAFITSSPRRSPAPPGMGGGGGASTPLSVHVMGDGSPPPQTAMSPRTGSLLDSIFSPVFNSIFGQKGEKGGEGAEGQASGAEQPRETRDAAAQRAAAAAAAAQHAAEARAAADAAEAAAAATAAADALADAEEEAASEEHSAQRRAEA